MESFTHIAIVTPIAELIASLGAARRFPLRVACFGEIEYRQDDPVYDTYTMPHTVALAECASLDEAIACVERYARQENFPTGEDDALGFLPQLFAVLDGEGNLVLTGEPWLHGVKWCDPVTSDDEARQVVEEASKLRAEASAEAGWDNHTTARRLSFRASVLEGRLVDPWWRQTVCAALLQAA